MVIYLSFKLSTLRMPWWKLLYYSLTSSKPTTMSGEDISQISRVLVLQFKTHDVQVLSTLLITSIGTSIYSKALLLSPDL